jgi:DNA-binding transcriptional MocR family regulator
VSLLFQGGFFIWVKLPSHINSVELEKATSEKYGIKFQVGPSFSVNQSTNAKSCFRICISYYDAKMLAESMKKICTEISVLDKQHK